MKYHQIPAQLFVKNRARLVSKLKPKSIVVLHSNDIVNTNADGTLPFKQNSNLFYLSGTDQEETILILAPDFQDESMREVLFLKETSELIAIWEGHKLTKEEGQAVSGVKNIKWKEDFKLALATILAETEHIYIPTNEHIRSSDHAEGANDRFIKWCKDSFPLHEYERLSPLLYDLRVEKSQEEVKLLQQACNITEKGFRRVLEYTQPGVWEFELEAEYAHEFLKNRSRGFAYAPIIAGGANACVLHYLDNDQQLKDGELLLMDVGAEYANYNGDMTRTIPVNGRFTKRQQQVYNAVLRVKNKASELLTPGTIIPEYHKAVGEIMQAELVDLGLIDKTDIKNQSKDRPAYKKYFMHGTSHHLGLDVHDVGSVFAPIKAGMVLTVEPGIYIREEGIGVRLEDDILITENGYVNLMGTIPIEIEEIEDLMNK